MRFLLGALVGLAWGALASLVNLKINQAALKKNSNSAVMAANIARLGVDLITLGTVFLLRKRLPFSFEATIIAAAVSLSILNVIFTYRLVGRQSSDRAKP